MQNDAIESKRKLVKVALQMIGLDSTLVGAEKHRLSKAATLWTPGMET